MQCPVNIGIALLVILGQGPYDGYRFLGGRGIVEIDQAFPVVHGLLKNRKVFPNPLGRETTACVRQGLPMDDLCFQDRLLGLTVALTPDRFG
jgi:hypothetical protein